MNIMCVIIKSSITKGYIKPYIKTTCKDKLSKCLILTIYTVVCCHISTCTETSPDSLQTIIIRLSVYRNRTKDLKVEQSMP